MALKKASSKSKKAIQKAVSFNMHELSMDNKKKGKARGAGGKARSHAQMVAIALSKASGR